MSGDAMPDARRCTIRPASASDFDQLRALDLEVFGELAYPYFVLRQLFDVHRECWTVAEHAARIVGYSLGVPTLDRDLAWLLGLAVAPDHRRLGFGRRLTVHSLDQLNTLGVPEVRLTVEPGNLTALGLYQQVGFCILALRRDYLGPGEDRVIMVRSFDAAARPGAHAHADDLDRVDLPSPRPRRGAAGQTDRGGTGGPRADWRGRINAESPAG